MAAHIVSLLLSATVLGVSCSPTSGTQDQSKMPFIKTLYQYPLGTWIENIAMRQSGELLLTLLGRLHIDQFTPSQVKARQPQSTHLKVSHELRVCSV
jgi:hypothetical protein